MSTNKLAVTSMKFVIIAVYVAVAATSADRWVIDDRGCRTPDQGVGDCIPLQDCRPLMDVIPNSPSLTNLPESLRGYVCGYHRKALKVCCPFGSKARKPTEPTVPAIPDMDRHKNRNLLPLNCGKVTEAIRISHGTQTDILEFPWMALLSYETGDNIDFKCGGTIINEWYVLTAAHCITHLTGLKLLGARLGEHNINTKEDCTEIDRGVSVCAPPVQDIGIGEAIPHPKYNPSTFTDDIGLIRLASPINITAVNAMPICLPTTISLRSIDLTAHKFTVTGWGMTESRQRSPELLKVDVPVLETEICRKAYQNSNAVVTPNQVCIANQTGTSCIGDSGGPLQKVEIFNEDVRYIQYGIVSYGSKLCGNTRYPSVYTRVDRYLDWILDNLRP